MAVGIKDIARKTGFSEATVSLALNNSSLVNENTREKIKEVAKNNGYIPNSAARNLARKKNFCIGLIVPDIENIFYASLVKYINEYSKAKSYNLIIAISDNNEKTEERIISDMIENRVEGVIIVPMNIPNKNPNYIKKLKDYQIPYIFCIDYYKELKEMAPIVMSELEKGMYNLTKKVIESGYKNIVYLTGFDTVPSLRLRQIGFENAAKEFGIKANIFRMEMIDYKTACKTVGEILEKYTACDAFLCVNDMVALGVLNTLSEMGLSVPEDIGVTGFDNIVFSEISYPKITTVTQNVEKIAQTSVECLLKMEEKENFQNYLIPTTIKMRNSIK